MTSSFSQQFCLCLQNIKIFQALDWSIGIMHQQCIINLCICLFKGIFDLNLLASIMAILVLIHKMFTYYRYESMSNQTKIDCKYYYHVSLQVSCLLSWFWQKLSSSGDCSYFNIIFKASKVESVFSKNSTSGSLTPYNSSHEIILNC